MKERLFGKDVELTPALKQKIKEEIGKIENKYFEKDSNEAHIHVTLKYSNKKHKHDSKYDVEVVLFYQSKTFKAEETTEDMYISIDKSFRVLDREVRKFRGKQRFRKK
ncbi:MAG: ribosome hibernation-promoting factor, HPF/YfiA family [Candidatus Woesearchaeota archaeon]